MRFPAAVTVILEVCGDTAPGEMMNELEACVRTPDPGGCGVVAAFVAVRIKDPEPVTLSPLKVATPPTAVVSEVPRITPPVDVPFGAVEIVNVTSAVESGPAETMLPLLSTIRTTG